MAPDRSNDPIGRVEPSPSSLGLPAAADVQVEPESEVPESPPFPEGHRDFLWQVHSYLNEHIRFADAKNGVVLAFSVGVLPAMTDAGELRRLMAVPLQTWSLNEWTTLGAVLLLVMAAICAGLSIRPRLPNPQPRGFIFWESIRAHGSAEEFQAALGREKSERLDRHLAVHVHVLAEVTHKKFFWSTWAIPLAVLGGIAAAMAFLLQQ